MNRILLLSAFLLFIFSSNANAAIVYVDSAQVGGTQTGASWATAFSSLQSALYLVNQNGSISADSIFIAKGTYYPTQNTSRDSAFLITTTNLKVYGGFPSGGGTRNIALNPTYLDGNIGNADSTDNSYHLIVIAITTPTSISDSMFFDGLNFRNANADGNDTSFFYNGLKFNRKNGGAVTLKNDTANLNMSHQVFNGCSFTKNYAANGGCFYNDTLSSVSYLNCSFGNNTGFSCAGVYGRYGTSDFYGCNFTNNKAGYMGAVCSYYSNTNYNNCIFTGNTSTGPGAGGMHNLSSTANISNCTFTGNSGGVSNPGLIGGNGGGAITNRGGTVYLYNDTFTNNSCYVGSGVYNNSATVTLDHCSFLNNSSWYGAGTYNINSPAKYKSCRFINNYGSGDGGGAIRAWYSATSLVNCLFYKNTTVSGSGGAIEFYNADSIPIIRNCTFTGNKQGTAPSGGAGSDIHSYGTLMPRITNSIFNSFCTVNILPVPAPGSVTYSLVRSMAEDTLYHLIGGELDPLYVNVSANDFRLKNNSPCINKGRNDSIPVGITTDLADSNRIVGGTVDLGAYENSTGVEWPYVYLGNDRNVCNGTTTVLDAGNPGCTYLWNTGATSQTISVSTTGYYSVKVTNAQNLITYDTVHLIYYPVPVVNLGNDMIICEGQTKILTNLVYSPTNTNLWSTGTTGTNLYVTTGGTYSVIATNIYGCEGYDTIQLTTVQPITVNLGADTTICAGSNLVLNASGPANSYQWSNWLTGQSIATTQTIFVSAAGTYKVVVIDTNSCYITDMIQVTTTTSPVVNIGNDTLICAGTSINLNAGNAGSTYLWSTGSTAQVANISNAGTYYVTVTNPNNCKGRDTINITANPSPIVNLGNDTGICNGGPVALTLNAQNPGSTYLWNNNSTAQTLNVTTGGTYYVTVTNPYQCKGRDTIVVASGIAPTVNLGNDTAFCAGNTLTLNAQNAGATYLWSNATTTQTTGVTASGTYYVTVTAPNLCKGRDTINVTVKPLPAVSLGSDTAFCAGNTIILDAQNVGASYLWNNAATTQTINASATGTYYVAVTGANQCIGGDTIQITINPLPEVNLGNDTAICNGTTIALTLNAQNSGGSYLWNDASINQTLDVNAAGAYDVTVTDANGCKGYDTIQISVAVLPLVDLGNDTTFCAGNGLTLNAQNSGAAYLWSTGASTQTININTTGTYGVEVTDANGCKGSDTIQATANPSPIVNLGNDVTVNTSSYTINAGNAGATYLWNTGATTQTLTVTTNGTYSVVVTNANGCSASDTIEVAFQPNGIDDVNTARNDIKVIPNPAKDVIYIQTQDNKLLNQPAILTDAYGRTVRMITIKSRSQELSLTGLAQGMYYLKIQTGGTLKIIKE